MNNLYSSTYVFGCQGFDLFFYYIWYTGRSCNTVLRFICIFRKIKLALLGLLSKSRHEERTLKIKKKGLGQGGFYYAKKQTLVFCPMLKASSVLTESKEKNIDIQHHLSKVLRLINKMSKNTTWSCLNSTSSIFEKPESNSMMCNVIILPKM